MKPLLQNHYIKEEYCSENNIRIEDDKIRPLYNWAYYLIQGECIFPLHKLLSDESWNFCLGGAVDLFILEEGKIKTIRIGNNIFEGDKLFYLVKRNTWFAARCALGSKYTLVTHCVSPGWVSEDDIPGYFEDMIKLLPDNPEFIHKFSWPR